MSRPLLGAKLVHVQIHQPGYHLQKGLKGFTINEMVKETLKKLQQHANMLYLPQGYTMGKMARSQTKKSNQRQKNQGHNNVKLPTLLSIL